MPANEGYELTFTPLPETMERSISDLSTHTLKALTHGAVGLSAAEQLLESRSLKSLELDADAEKWAAEKLFTAAEKWQRYADCMTDVPPLDTKGLKTLFPNLSTELQTLYKAALEEDDVSSVDIVMIPYGDLLKNLDMLPQWLALMRKKQDPSLNTDDIAPGILMRLSSQSEHGVHTTGIGDSTETMQGYLECMSTTTNGWRLMAIGSAQQLGDGDDDIPFTVRFSKNRSRLNYRDFGVAEWLAYSLQESVSSTEQIVLTGSSFPTNSVVPLVGMGKYDVDENRHNMTMIPANVWWPGKLIVPSLVVE